MKMKAPEYSKQKGHRNRSRILFLFVTVAITSFTISLVVSIVNLGLAPNFLQIWARNYAIAFIVALPAAYVASRIAGKVSGARLTA